MVLELFGRVLMELGMIVRPGMEVLAAICNVNSQEKRRGSFAACVCLPGGWAGQLTSLVSSEMYCSRFIFWRSRAMGYPVSLKNKFHRQVLPGTSLLPETDFTKQESESRGCALASLREDTSMIWSKVALVTHCYGNAA